MKRIVAILLLCSLSCQCLVKLGIVAWFGLNREYIARNLCENKDKPELKCCGKCYLKKQLKKADAEEKKQDSPAAKSNRLELTAFVLPSRTATPLSFIASLSPVQNPGRSAHHGILFSVPVFHPPAVFC